MRTLKSIIYVYEEEFVVSGHRFKYEMSKSDRYTLFYLYDSEKNEQIIASGITTYHGLIAIAEAYLTGNRESLAEAKYRNCI